MDALLSIDARSAFQPQRGTMFIDTKPNCLKPRRGEMFHHAPTRNRSTRFSIKLECIFLVMRHLELLQKREILLTERLPCMVLLLVLDVANDSAQLRMAV